MKIFAAATIMKIIRKEITMLNEQTIMLLNKFKLFGMANGFSERLSRTDHAGLSHSEFVGMIVDDEKIYRENAKLKKLLKRAHLKQNASIEDIDYRHPRGLSKQLMSELSSGNWLANHQNIILCGPTGIGKSFLACALGNQACRLGFSTQNIRFPRLLEMLYASRGDGSHLKQLNKLAKVQLLILEDFGLSPLSDTERKDLLEIVEDRYGETSTIITTQLPIKTWHDVIGEATIADAICDRLLAKAYKIELRGESMRKKEVKP